MYDASKYADDRPSLSSDSSTAVALRRGFSSAGQFMVSEQHSRRRGRPLPVSASMSNGLVCDAAPPPSAAGDSSTTEPRKAVNGLSSSPDRCRRCTGPRLDVPAAIASSVDDGTLRSPDSVASTLSSPADVRPSSDLFGSTTVSGSGQCRHASLADEYFPVTLGCRRSTDPGQVPVAVAATSTTNGRHHRHHHSHHRRHRQHNGQGQGHGRPSSGQSSSSSNSRSSVGCVYPAATASNGAVVNGRLRYVMFPATGLRPLTYATSLM